MVTVPDKIIKLINRFIEELKNNNIKIEQAILFGSYAHGTYNEWSDIDLALVSKDFKGEHFEDRKKIREIKLAISSGLEARPYTPDEFNQENPFIQRIIETGIRIV